MSREWALLDELKVHSRYCYQTNQSDFMLCKINRLGLGIIHISYVVSKCNVHDIS
jgi:hypothetical protein